MTQLHWSYQGEFGGNEEHVSVTSLSAQQLDHLSILEYQLLYLACRGLSNREIAARLYSNESLVSVCLEAVAVKMGLANSETLVATARASSLFVA